MCKQPPYSLFLGEVGNNTDRLLVNRTTETQYNWNVSTSLPNNNNYVFRVVEEGTPSNLSEEAEVDNITITDASTEKKRSLGLKLGLGLGISLGLVLIALGWFLFFTLRKRRRNRPVPVARGVSQPPIMAQPGQPIFINGQWLVQVPVGAISHEVPGEHAVEMRTRANVHELSSETPPTQLP
jgi:hypothetical protein